MVTQPLISLNHFENNFIKAYRRDLYLTDSLSVTAQNLISQISRWYSYIFISLLFLGRLSTRDFFYYEIFESKSLFLQLASDTILYVLYDLWNLFLQYVG